MQPQTSSRNPRIKPRSVGLAIACLTLLLSSCAAGPGVLVTHKSLPDRIPNALTEPTPAPALAPSRTNSDLLQFALDAISSLQACNADKADIRVWTERPRP